MQQQPVGTPIQAPPMGYGAPMGAPPPSGPMAAGPPGTASVGGDPEPNGEVVVEVACGSCKKQVKVSASSGRCQYSCPSCGARNEFQVGGASASAQPAPDTPVEYPSYWNLKDEENAEFTACDNDVKAAVQAMMTATWKNQWTRDRGKERKVDKFEVVTVQRNANPQLWKEYYRTRERLGKVLESQEIAVYDDIKTQSLTTKSKEAAAFFAQADLKQDVNEFYLFHGTSPAAATAICKNDFRIDKAGSNAGTLYGPGVYMAEASTKADEYAKDDKDSIFKDMFGMLICRVVCGNIRYSDEVSPPVQDLVDSILKRGTHHSVLGDREKCRGTYREFIVFDKAQIYPEYVVIYKRVQ